MNTIDVTVVRIYTLERAKNFSTIINYLQKDIQIRGVSVFRAISGFGASGSHSASLMDLSFSLPLIIEFFDEPEKVNTALEYLSTIIEAEHLLFFPGKANATTG